MSKKKTNEVKKRHFFVIKILWPYLIWKFARRYKFKYQQYKNIKGPLLILGNHTVAEDPILLSFLFPQWHNYYIASEQIFNLGLLSKMLVWAVNPIKKSKSMSDLSTIRKAKQIVNEGGTVAMFAEGNMTYSGQTVTINPAVVKLVRLLKCPVALYNTEGLYLSNPRWAVKPKKGKTTGYIKQIIEPSEYQALSDDELYQLIKDGLMVDCYDNKVLGEQKYVGDDLALGLERLLFVDLKTGKPFKTYTAENRLYSHDSDFTLRYDSYGYLYDQNNARYTLRQLELKTYESYIKFLDNNEYICDELIMLEKTTDTKKKKLGEHIVNFYQDKIILIKEGQEELVFNFNEISTLAIQGKKKIIIYVQDETYLMTLNELSSPLKYLVAYQYYNYKQGDQKDGLHISTFGL